MTQQELKILCKVRYTGHEKYFDDYYNSMLSDAEESRLIKDCENCIHDKRIPDCMRCVHNEYMADNWEPKQ